MTAPDWYPTIAVACYRSPFLALVLLRGTDPLAVRTPCLRGGSELPRQLDQMITGFVLDRGPELLVVESRTARHLGMPPTSTSHVRTISLAEAKVILLPGRRATHQHLYDHLLREHPSLRSFATVAPETGRVSRPWQAVKLLAIALGLAASRFPAGRPLTSTSFS